MSAAYLTCIEELCVKPKEKINAALFQEQTLQTILDVKKMSTLSRGEAVEFTPHHSRKRRLKTLLHVFQNVSKAVATTARDGEDRIQAILVLLTTSVAPFQATLELQRRASANEDSVKDFICNDDAMSCEIRNEKLWAPQVATSLIEIMINLISMIKQVLLLSLISVYWRPQ